MVFSPEILLSATDAMLESYKKFAVAGGYSLFIYLFILGMNTMF